MIELLKIKLLGTTESPPMHWDCLSMTSYFQFPSKAKGLSTLVRVNLTASWIYAESITMNIDNPWHRSTDKQRACGCRN